VTARPAAPCLGAVGHVIGNRAMSSSFPGEVSASADPSLDLIRQVERRMLTAVGVTPASATTTQPALMRACAHHLGAGGQRVRAMLALKAGVALGVRDADAVAIAATAELLHNAWLIHDDLQDRSEQRRGAPTVHSAFGGAIALCAGDLLLSGAYGVLASYSRTASLPWLLALTHAAVADAAQGQPADTAAPPDSADAVAWYSAIATAKSGALLRLPLELAVAAAGRPEALSLARRAAEAFAVGYQIADDIEDAREDAAAGSLNLLLLLRAAGPEAEAGARGLARRHLEAARALARELPEGSGQYLAQLAQTRAARL